MAEKDEKETKTRIDTRSGEIERDTKTRSGSDRGYNDDDDDRPRRSRDGGESVRETSRSVRRFSNDFLTAGCDVFGDLLSGLGDAFTSRRRSRSSSSDDDDRDNRSNNCFDQFGIELRTYNRSDRDDESDSSDDQGGGNRDRGYRYQSRSVERSSR